MVVRQHRVFILCMKLVLQCCTLKFDTAPNLLEVFSISMFKYYKSFKDEKSSVKLDLGTDVGNKQSGYTNPVFSLLTCSQAHRGRPNTVKHVWYLRFKISTIASVLSELDRYKQSSPPSSQRSCWCCQATVIILGLEANISSHAIVDRNLKYHLQFSQQNSKSV